MVSVVFVINTLQIILILPIIVYIIILYTIERGGERERVEFKLQTGI